MTIRVLDEADYGAWDEMVSTSPNGNVFMQTRVLKALGVKFGIRAKVTKGRIEFGAVETIGIGGVRTNALFVKYLGLAFPRQKQEISRPKHLKKMYDAVGEYCASVRGYYDYTFDPSFEVWIPFFWEGYKQTTLYSYTIPCADQDDWWRRADSKLRNACRKAESTGVTVQRRSLENRDEIYSLCAEPFKHTRMGSPMKPDQFERLVDELMEAGSLEMWSADSQDGEAMCGAVVLSDHRNSYFLMNGSRDHAPTGANALLVKTLVEDAHRRGLNFDFEGSMMRSIERFYRSFGGVPQPYHRIWRPSLFHSGLGFAKSIARKLMGYAR